MVRPHGLPPIMKDVMMQTQEADDVALELILKYAARDEVESMALWSIDLLEDAKTKAQQEGLTFEADAITRTINLLS